VCGIGTLPLCARESADLDAKNAAPMVPLKKPQRFILFSLLDLIVRFPGRTKSLSCVNDSILLVHPHGLSPSRVGEVPTHAGEMTGVLVLLARQSAGTGAFES